MLIKNFHSSDSCGVLDIPAGASLEIITDGSSTAASYKCMEGYSLLGSANLVCRSNGDWDLLPPSCGKSEPTKFVSLG